MRDSKYLLSGLARCGCCEANIVAVPRPSGSGSGRRSLRYYGCSWHNNRGITVCPNSHRVEMSSVDDRVIEAIEHLVLTPAHIAYVVDGAARLVAQQLAEAPGRAEMIAAEIAKLRREADRLVAAIAVDDSPQALISGLKDRETRIHALQLELDSLGAGTALSALDLACLKRTLRDRAAHLKDDLHADVPAARAALRKLLDGPLVFRPVMVGHHRKTYAFEGHTRVGALLDSVYLEVASPRGFEPRLPP